MATRYHRSGALFAAVVKNWTLEVKDYIKLVYQEALLELIMRMQRSKNAGGAMPVMTGFLRSSLMVSTAPLPYPNRERPEGWSFGWSMADVYPVIKNFKTGQTVYIGYGAIYAEIAELNNGFQRLAIQAWPVIVEQVKAQLGGMVR